MICNDNPSSNGCTIIDELTGLDVLDEDTFLLILVSELIILRATQIKEDEKAYISLWL